MNDSQGRVGAPGDAGAPVRDLHPTSDIRFVIIQVAKLEERIDQLIDESKSHKKDFRWTWGGLVFGFLMLATFIIGVYTRIDDKFDKVGDKIGSVATAVGRIETSVGKVDARIEDIQSKLATLKR